MLNTGKENIRSIQHFQMSMWCWLNGLAKNSYNKTKNDPACKREKWMLANFQKMAVELTVGTCNMGSTSNAAMSILHRAPCTFLNDNVKWMGLKVRERGEPKVLRNQYTHKKKKHSLQMKAPSFVQSRKLIWKLSRLATIIKSASCWNCFFTAFICNNMNSSCTFWQWSMCEWLKGLIIWTLLKAIFPTCFGCNFYLAIFSMKSVM